MKATNKTSFYLSVISFLISSVTILFMPFGSFEQDGKQTLAFILAIVFWLFFILGFVFLLPISKQRKSDKNFKSKGGIGLLRFFSNKPAMIADGLMIAGIIALILTFIIPTLPGWITLVATFTAVFFLEMHGIFNGMNYEYMSKTN